MFNIIREKPGLCDFKDCYTASGYGCDFTSDMLLFHKKLRAKLLFTI